MHMVTMHALSNLAIRFVNWSYCPYLFKAGSYEYKYGAIVSSKLYDSYEFDCAMVIIWNNYIVNLIMIFGGWIRNAIVWRCCLILSVHDLLAPESESESHICLFDALINYNKYLLILYSYLQTYGSRPEISV